MYMYAVLPQFYCPIDFMKFTGWKNNLFHETIVYLKRWNTQLFSISFHEPRKQISVCQVKSSAILSTSAHTVTKIITMPATWSTNLSHWCPKLHTFYLFDEIKLLHKEICIFSIYLDGSNEIPHLMPVCKWKIRLITKLG